MSDAQRRESRLAHFPVTFFAVVMGLAGLTLALHAAHGAAQGGALAGPLHLANRATMIFSFAVAITLGALYTLKWLRFPAQARAEWDHPVKISFFPALSISTLLLGTALMPASRGAAEMLWLIGMIAQGALTLAVVSSWISHRAFEQGHLTPAWFIPAVGNIVVPVAGAPLGYAEISWLFFSTGLLFWIVLLTLVFNRLIFHHPIPGRLYPTLVVLIAPPAVGYVAWMRLTGEMTHFAHILLEIGYLFALIVLVQVPKLAKLPFALSFWALSFPVAALTIASFLHGKAVGSLPHVLIGAVLLAVLSVLVVGLLIRTARAVLAHEICVPEGPERPK